MSEGKRFTSIGKSVSETSVSEHDKKMKEQLTILEALDIGPAQLASCALIVLGAKPATEVDVFAYNASPEDVQAVLEKIGLAVAEKPLPTEHKSPILRARFVVARDKTTLEELLRAEGYRDHVAYGLLMGFPKTAVDAFVSGDVLPEDQRPGLEGLFPTFTLSREHWREEQEIQEEWKRLLKAHIPAIYRSLLPTDQE